MLKVDAILLYDVDDNLLTKSPTHLKIDHINTFPVRSSLLSSEGNIAGPELQQMENLMEDEMESPMKSGLM